MDYHKVNSNESKLIYVYLKVLFKRVFFRLKMITILNKIIHSGCGSEKKTALYEQQTVLPRFLRQKQEKCR